MTTTATTQIPAVPAIGSLVKLILTDRLWHAPLVSLALAGTLGIALDRTYGIPFPVSLLVAIGSLLVWALVFWMRSRREAIVYLWLATAALGAAHHHCHCHIYAPDEIGFLVDETPLYVRLRGVLIEKPYAVPREVDSSLQSWVDDRPPQAISILEVTQIQRANDWHAVSGRVRVRLVGPFETLHVGDEVDVSGRIASPGGPENPGGFDFQSHLRDQRIRVVLTPDGGHTSNVVRLSEGSPASLWRQLGRARNHCREIIEKLIPQKLEAGLAAALLLGDGSGMSPADWDQYMRTGVIHVLVVSGQHLAIVGGCLLFVFSRIGNSRRWYILFVGLILLCYSLMVGGQPPVMRAVGMALIAYGAIWWRRPRMVTNSFAAAWILVGVLNPTDLANTGCKLSFLSVALLVHLVAQWSYREMAPLDRLVFNARPAWQRLLLKIGKSLLFLYLGNIAIWLAVSPLIASRYHLIPPIGIVISPFVVLLSGLALILGFLMLATALVSPTLALPFAWGTRWSLKGCDTLVNRADTIPYGSLYVSDIPEWWLWGFYGGLLAVLLLESLKRHWRWFLLGGLGWLCVGLLGGAASRTSDELRCTFLSVGHGGCAVLETPDGRTILYDIGSLANIDVARRHVAPFLWHRGIRRIDEVIVSHADLDHYNGLQSLLKYFAVGQVTLTPTFSERENPSVRKLMEELERRGIPLRRVWRGHGLRAGDVAMEVLHPPQDGPLGSENVRSLVLEVRHADNILLLTGDLEGVGLQSVLAMPPRRVDVLMAPHHGSPNSNTFALARWANPRVVIASEGKRDRSALQSTYPKAHVFDTGTRGAITVRSHQTGLVLELFRRRERIALMAGVRPPETGGLMLHRLP